jgi:hypothetical protein
MDRRSLTLVLAALVSVVAGASHLTAQSNPYAKLIGTWVMDSTNGADDKGLPKTEQLVFTRAGAGIRITATSDQGKGPSTSGFNCLAGGAMTDLGKSQSMRCTIQTTPDSVMYALDLVDGAKTSPVERGRLVVLPSGLLRDQYDAVSSTPPTHHRHIYHKVS